MARMPLFSSPLLLGFDHFERTLERVAKAAQDGYPPYNVEQIGNDGLRLTLAVAGFGDSDLEITLEDNQLIVRGHQTDDPRRVYLHRGIASRQFQRRFVLADGVEIAGATLDSGLLNIDLRRPQPSRSARTIKISAASADANVRNLTVAARR